MQERVDDVQERSRHAARALVERLIATVDGERAVDDGEPLDGAEDDDVAGSAEPHGVFGADLVDSWAELWRTTMTSLAAAVTDAAASPSKEARLEIGSPIAAAPIRVVVDPATWAGTADVWVHNPTDADIDELHLHCSPPRSHDGRGLGDAAVRFDPNGFELPARSSRGVRVAVEANGAPVGVFRGILQVRGIADQWLPIEIEIAEPGA
jgi:hypothetical protein